MGKPWALSLSNVLMSVLYHPLLREARGEETIRVITNQYADCNLRILISYQQVFRQWDHTTLTFSYWSVLLKQFFTSSWHANIERRCDKTRADGWSTLYTFTPYTTVKSIWHYMWKSSDMFDMRQHSFVPPYTTLIFVLCSPH